MAVDTVIRVSFTQFSSFQTEAFNSRPGQRPMEITDRGQLRRLLKEKRMVEQGDSTSYFGSNPKSAPSWDDVCKHGSSGATPEMIKRSKLVKVSNDPVGDIKKLDLAADQTDFGRRQSATRPEFVVGRP